MTDVVYMTPTADVYHAYPDCHHLSEAVLINEFPAEEARSLSALDSCLTCVDNAQTESRDVRVCPECKQPDIRARVGFDEQERYHCGDCDATFRDPETREQSYDNHCRRGLPAELIEADAEEVSRDE
jgi:ssDNA-binding Zn-finger/Zn-ribbon topoisomerase 1